MRNKLLGRSGLRVSELCLGTMTFGETWGWGAPKAEYKKMFALFAKSDGNFIDTSVNFTDGESETILGDLLKADRDHFVVATKYILTQPENPIRGTRSPENFGGSWSFDVLDGDQLDTPATGQGADHPLHRGQDICTAQGQPGRPGVGIES